MALSDTGPISDRRLLEAVCKNASLALFLMDERHHCAYMNPAAEILTGFCLDELRGKPLHDFVHHSRPDGTAYPIDECPIDRAAPENHRIQGEEVFVHKDGSFYPVAYTASPISAEGSFLGTVVEVRDISRDKQVEAERQGLLEEIRRQRDQLSDERARLEAMLEQMPAGVMVAEVPTGRLLLANSRVDSILGHRLMEAEGIADYSAYRGFHSDGRPYEPHEWPLARTVLTGEVITGEEIEYVRGDGVQATLLANSGPIRDGDGRTVAALVAFVDITARRRTEQFLRDSEERFRMVFQHSHDAIFVLSPERNAVLEVNPAGVAMFGYGSREELLATPLTEFHPEDFASFVEFVRTVHEEGAGWTDEFVCRAKGGRLVASEISASSIIVDNQRCLLAMVRDVGERNQVVKALGDSEARLRAIYDNVQVGITEVDLDGRFQGVNEALCQITGYSREELIGRQFADITHPEDLDANFEALRRLDREDGQTQQLDKRYVHKSGHDVWVTLNITPIRDEAGRLISYLGAVQDITERKQAEEHRKLLLNELNHRVRNTLAAVQAIASQTLRGTAVHESARKALEGRIFSLSRAHSLLTSESWSGASLRDVVAQSLQPFGFCDGQPGQVSAVGDEVRLNAKTALALMMAFHELGNNAAKYGALSSKTGRIDLNWRIQQTGDGDQLWLNWREKGGPPVEPPESEGFGSVLLQRGLPRDLKGDVRLDYAPDGLTCQMCIPIAP